MPICFIYNAFETILNFSNIDNKMRNVYWKSYFHIKSGFQYKKLQYLFIWVSEFQTPLLISKFFKISNEYPQHRGVWISDTLIHATKSQMNINSIEVSECRTPLQLVYKLIIMLRVIGVLPWIPEPSRRFNLLFTVEGSGIQGIGVSEIQTFEYLPTQKYNYRYFVAIYCKSVRNSDILVSCFSYYMDI
jgi:hypothetical protein